MLRSLVVYLTTVQHVMGVWAKFCDYLEVLFTFLQFANHIIQSNYWVRGAYYLLQNSK